MYYFGGPGAGYGLLFAVVVSGIITAVGWVVARNKQKKLEQLEAEMEAESDAQQAAWRAEADRSRQAREQQVRTAASE